MFWKVVFFGLLAVGLGVIWQSEYHKELLISELKTARVSINSFTARFEGWQVIVVSIGMTLIVSSICSFIFDEHIYSLRKRIVSATFRSVRKIPGVRSKIKREVDKYVSKLIKDLPSKDNDRTELPKRGLSHEEVMKEVAHYSEIAEIDWSEGWVSGALYNSSPELTKLNTEIFEKTVWSNPLHPEVFPQICKMEAEVVQWTVNIFNGGKDACGIMSSGGTESILLAMKSYREMGYERGIKYPEIVCAVSAHCAFNKAAEYLRMKLIQVPVDTRTYMVDLKAMARAITSNTIVLVGSAPHYPHGIIDPIQDIAKLAIKYDIGLHVDCCLGGFVLPFIEKAGYQIEPFDFRVKGVTSISADTHKYGCTPKGSSVVMYSNKELRQKQYFVAPNWQGGVYATTGISGSRAGCLIATTWATLLYMGEDGYVEATRKILETVQAIVKGVEDVAGIYIMGKPKAMVVAVNSADFDIARLADALMKKGWKLNVLQYPTCFHLCITTVHTKEGVADRFVNDIKECVAIIMKNPKAKTTGKAALYGTAATLPDRSIVDEIARGFLDLSLTVTPPE